MATYRKRGSLKDSDLVIKELEPLIKALGHFPNGNEMRENGLGSIEAAINKYHDGMKDFAEKHGYRSQRSDFNDFGYWNDFENIEKEINDLEKQIGKVPSLEDMRKAKKTMLAKAINNNGGFTEVMKKIGKEPLQEARNHWKSFCNIEKILSPICKELSRFPTQKELTDRGHHNVIGPIYDYHEGMDAVAEKLGYQTKRASLGMVKIYHWNDIDNIKEYIEEIQEKIGHFPSSLDLINLGESGVLNSINRVHGGINKVKDAMNITKTKTILKTKSGRWVKSSYELIFSNILELNDIKFEYEKYIADTGYRSDFSVIATDNNEYYIEIFGYSNSSASSRSIRYNERRKIKGEIYKNSNLNLIIFEPEDFERSCLDDVHSVIKSKLCKIGIHIKELNNDDRINILYGTSEDISSLEQDLLPYIKDGVLPSGCHLKKINKSGLAKKIVKFGGMYKIAEILGLQTVRESKNQKPSGFWNIWENLEEEIMMVYEELGHFPTENELDLIGKGKIAKACQTYYGGLIAVKEKFEKEDSK
jgi:archaellum component FlaC